MKMSHSSIERSLTIIEVSLSIYKKRHGNGGGAMHCSHVYDDKYHISCISKRHVLKMGDHV